MAIASGATREAISIERMSHLNKRKENALTIYQLRKGHTLSGSLNLLMEIFDDWRRAKVLLSRGWKSTQLFGVHISHQPLIEFDADFLIGAHFDDRLAARRHEDGAPGEIPVRWFRCRRP